MLESTPKAVRVLRALFLCALVTQCAATSTQAGRDDEISGRPAQARSAYQRRETLAGFTVKKHYKCIASTCTDTWCDANCNHVPVYCPASFCRVAAPAPPPGPPTWGDDYISGPGLPYDANNEQLPVYAHAEDTAAACVESCTENSWCVAVSWRSTGTQKRWCVSWRAYCNDEAPAHVSGYVSEAGTTTTWPSKIVEPSTLPASATAWATRELGWTTWRLGGEWASYMGTLL